MHQESRCCDLYVCSRALINPDCFSMSPYGASERGKRPLKDNVIRLGRGLDWSYRLTRVVRARLSRSLASLALFSYHLT